MVLRNYGRIKQGARRALRASMTTALLCARSGKRLEVSLYGRLMTVHTHQGLIQALLVVGTAQLTANLSVQYQ